MTPERAVAHRCCGPFLYPFSTPPSPWPRPIFLPFRGISTQTTSQKSPKILPSEGDSARKRRSKSLPVPPNFPQRLPLASPQSNPRCCSEISKISSRIGCISNVFHLFFPRNLPGAIPLEGRLAGRTQGGMSGNVWCEAIP